MFLYTFLISRIDISDEYRIASAALLLFTASTDILDGYLARKYNEITEFGKIIDPLADKVVVGMVIIQLYLMNKISDFYFTIVIARDLIIFLGGIFVSKRIGKVLPSNILGKITVLSIGIFILAVILQLQFIVPTLHKGIYFLSIILIFSSLVGYIIRAKESLMWYKKYESLQKL